MHIHGDRRKLLLRVRRIRGQIEAIERAIESDDDCAQILHQIAASRGALGGLMSQVIDGHVHFHVLDPHARSSKSQSEAAEQLLAVVRTYLT